MRQHFKPRINSWCHARSILPEIPRIEVPLSFPHNLPQRGTSVQAGGITAFPGTFFQHILPNDGFRFKYQPFLGGLILVVVLPDYRIRSIFFCGGRPFGRLDNVRFIRERKG